MYPLVVICISQKPVGKHCLIKVTQALRRQKAKTPRVIEKPEYN
jgi:hypothetical protein